MKCRRLADCRRAMMRGRQRRRRSAACWSTIRQSSFRHRVQAYQQNWSPHSHQQQHRRRRQSTAATAALLRTEAAVVVMVAVRRLWWRNTPRSRRQGRCSAVATWSGSARACLSLRAPVRASVLVSSENGATIPENGATTQFESDACSGMHHACMFDCWSRYLHVGGGSRQETPLLRHLYIKMHHFTKTGSGQT